ncbi:hypothetical protein DC498_10085 [Terrimonas sp.]|nr:hypothetical protein DC498_10085 [Terrimonas sp.]
MQRSHFPGSQHLKHREMQVKQFGLFSILLLLIFFLSCKKHNTYLHNAEIIGMDGRYCGGCCGGYMIVIDGKQPSNGDSFFLISEMPSAYNITNNTIFPVKVKIDFSIDEGRCSNNFVKISRITAM